MAILNRRVPTPRLVRVVETVSDREPALVSVPEKVMGLGQAAVVTSAVATSMPVVVDQAAVVVVTIPRSLLVKTSRLKHG